jgi:hypothetical protein
MIPMKKSEDGQAKFYQSFLHFTDINTAKSGGINSVKYKKIGEMQRKLVTGQITDRFHQSFSPILPREDRV